MAIGSCLDIWPIGQEYVCADGANLTITRKLSANTGGGRGAGGAAGPGEPRGPGEPQQPRGARGGLPRTGCYGSRRERHPPGVVVWPTSMR